MEERRRAEEALLGDLALVGALGHVGMGLARGVPSAGAAGSSSWPWSPPLPYALQHAAADLVELDRFEQGLEVALAEALVALALDDLEEDRADHVLGEDLQQQPAALGRRAVDQDAVGLQPLQVLAVARQARVELLVIGVGHGLELHALALERLDRVVDVVGAERDVLDALAVIVLRNSSIWDWSSWLSFSGMRILPHGLVMALDIRPGLLALDVEVADLAEIEEALVEVGPSRHVAAMDVVRQVVDVGEADALGIVLDAGQIHEVDVVDLPRSP